MPLDYDAYNQKKGRSGTRSWTPKEGTNVIRVFPHTQRFYNEAMSDFAIPFESHFLRVERDLTVTICPRHVKDFCPMCEVYWAHRQTADPALAKILSSGGIKPGSRFLMNILDLNNVEAGIQPYEANWTVGTEIRKYVGNPAWGDFFSPVSGRNFHVELTPGNRNPTGRNSYRVEPAPQPTDVSSFLPGDWLAQLDGLEGALPPQSSLEELMAIHQKLGLPAVPNMPVVVGAPAPTPQAAPVAPQPHATGGHPAAPQPTPQAPAAPAPTPAPAPTSQPAPAAPQAPAPDAPAAPAAGPAWPAGLTLNPETGKPTCFGLFAPEKYPCDSCPAKVQCQMKALNIG